MTGAPLPAGADAVVPVEDVSQLADGRIKIHKPISSGQFIVPRGADCSAGRVILEKGALLGPAQIAAAATVGAARVSVYAPPHVSILTTGDEIVPLDAAPAPGQIRNANGILLTSLVKKWGCELIETSAVRDDRDALGEAIAEGLAGDVLFITGGMSMGRHDHVPSLLREMGAAFHITKLKIKPGKPFVMATWRDQTTGRECQIIGLPGNPLSAFVCATRLAWRLLARMAGRRVLEQWITATLKLPLPPNGPREFYQPARLLREGDQLMIEPLDWKNSGDVFTMASADALLIRPESQPAVAAGSAVRAMMI
jgi:molybdopterin molybdotransferase